MSLTENETKSETMLMLQRQVEAQTNYYANLLNLLDADDEDGLFSTEFAENEGIEDRSDAYDHLHDSALSIDTKRTERVCLTFGGPNIFVDVEVVGTGHRSSAAWTESATLVAGWGFESIEKRLNDDDPLAEAAYRLVQSKLDCE